MLEASGDRVTWTYDPTYQLVNERRSGVSSYNVTHTYDSAANRTVKFDGTTRTTFTYNDGNELQTSNDGSGRTTYVYDPSGNVTAKRFPAGTITTFAWDYENRNTQAQLSATNRVTFAYDPDSHRVQKATTSLTEKFVYDGENIVLETDGSNLTRAAYTLEPQEHGNLVSQRRSVSGSWIDVYHHFDILGSTADLSDSSAVVTDSYTYYAFGEIVVSSGSTENPYTWVGMLGYWNDSELTRFHTGERDYDPVVARYGSRDPIGKAAGANDYDFVANNPINKSDPSGLQPDDRKALQERLDYLLSMRNRGDRAMQSPKRYDAEIERLRRQLDSMPGSNDPGTTQDETPRAVQRNISEGEMEKLARDKLVQFYKGGDRRYAVAIDAAGGHVAALVYKLIENQTPTMIEGGGSVPMTTGWSYRLVAVNYIGGFKDSRDDLVDPDELVHKLRNQRSVDRHVEARMSTEEVHIASVHEEVSTFLLHMVPVGAAIDHATKGEKGEVALALTGDLAFFLSLGSSYFLSAAGKAANAAKAERAIATAYRLEQVSIGLNATVGAVRGTQGIFALRDEKTGEAAGYFGEAFLRLAGVSISSLGKLKEIKAARSAAASASSAEAQAARGTTAVESTASSATTDIAEVVAESAPHSKFPEAGFSTEVNSGRGITQFNTTFKGTDNSGVLETTYTKKTGDLYVDVIRSEVQRQGLGEAMLRKTIAEVESKGGPVKTLSGNLERVNRAEFLKGGLESTPAYKQRRALGFTEVVVSPSKENGYKLVMRRSN
jgi:RHS repeat-associated protein